MSEIEESSVRKGQGPKVAIAQIDPALGDLTANMEKHREAIARAKEEGVDVLVFPELSLSGYRLKDSVPEVALTRDCPEFVELADLSKDLSIVAGLVLESSEHFFFNAAVYFEDGKAHFIHRKVYLPTYGMFDEQRYFARGNHIAAFATKHGKMAILQLRGHAAPERLDDRRARRRRDRHRSFGEPGARRRRRGRRRRERPCVGRVQPRDGAHVRDLRRPRQPRRCRRRAHVLGRLRAGRPERRDAGQGCVLRNRISFLRCFRKACSGANASRHRCCATKTSISRSTSSAACVDASVPSRGRNSGVMRPRRAVTAARPFQPGGQRDRGRGRGGPPRGGRDFATIVA